MVYKFHLPSNKSTHKRLKDLSDALVSLSGITGREIVNQEGQILGSLVDLVCHWDSAETYPPLTGIIAKVARRNVWIPISYTESIKPNRIKLNDSKLDLREFKPRNGEVRLTKEVLDHQLIDVDGARVVRASDLYVAYIGKQPRLVGVDVGYKPLIKRLGPSVFRAKVSPDSVIDWATIESFGNQDSNQPKLKLSANRQELRKMRPGELADLLEDLGRQERQELLKVLTPDLAADALEEMEPKELEGLLRESSIESGSKYLASMEPDEAADALRDIDENLRNDLMNIMPKDKSSRIDRVLKYDEETAGGIMNTILLFAKQEDLVGDIIEQLKNSESDLGSLNSIVITDGDGKLLYDLELANLLIADKNTPLKKLMKPPATVTVAPDASIKEVAEILVESRSFSIVVVDSSEKPIGRIYADDLLDVLIPSERFHFPRLLSS